MRNGFFSSSFTNAVISAASPLSKRASLSMKRPKATPFVYVLQFVQTSRKLYVQFYYTNLEVSKDMSKKQANLTCFPLLQVFSEIHIFEFPEVFFHGFLFLFFCLQVFQCLIISPDSLSSHSFPSPSGASFSSHNAASTIQPAISRTASAH